MQEESINSHHNLQQMVEQLAAESEKMKKLIRDWIRRSKEGYGGTGSLSAYGSGTVNEELCAVVVEDVSHLPEHEIHTYTSQSSPIFQGEADGSITTISFPRICFIRGAAVRFLQPCRKGDGGEKNPNRQR